MRWAVNTYGRIHHHVLYTGADLESVYTCDLDLLDPMDLKSCKHSPDFFDRQAIEPLSAHFYLSSLDFEVERSPARFLRPPGYWTSVGAFYLVLGFEVARSPARFLRPPGY